jgi:D-3-phosphoglycerate dehydrogenase / 2-oxoglutarate reductase
LNPGPRLYTVVDPVATAIFHRHLDIIMSNAQNINRPSGLDTTQRSVSHSWTSNNAAPASPIATFSSPPSSWVGNAARHGGAPKQLKPFNTQDIKILLLENVNQSGRDILSAQGYQVEALKTSLGEDELIEKIR